MSCKKILPHIGQNRQKWPNGSPNLDADTCKTKIIGLCNHKNKLLSGITFTVSLKSVIHIYANLSDPPPYLLKVTLLEDLWTYSFYKLATI